MQRHPLGGSHKNQYTRCVYKLPSRRYWCSGVWQKKVKKYCSPSKVSGKDYSRSLYMCLIRSLHLRGSYEYNKIGLFHRKTGHLSLLSLYPGGGSWLRSLLHWLKFYGTSEYKIHWPPEPGNIEVSPEQQPLTIRTPNECTTSFPGDTIRWSKTEGEY